MSFLEGAPIHKTKPRYPEDKCGNFAVFGNEENDASYLVAQGLVALQPRGQDNAGAVSATDSGLHVVKGAGLVAQVLGNVDFQQDLPGTIASGHVRYGTSSKRAAYLHSQPVYRPHPTLRIPTRREFAMGQNGNEPDTGILEKFLDKRGLYDPLDNDAEMMYAAVGYYIDRGASLPEAMAEAKPLFKGAYGLVATDKDHVVGLRDDVGVRLLSIGKRDRNLFLSTETAGFDAVSAEFIRDVRPGEMVIFDQSGLTSVQLGPNVEAQPDGFEFVYIARNASVIDGISVAVARQHLGEELYKEEKEAGNVPDVDMIISSPDGGNHGTLGYHMASGIPIQFGVDKNPYVGRSFMQATQRERESTAGAKHNPIKAIVKGKRVMLGEDSVVRGTTGLIEIEKLRAAGAREVHLRVFSPQIYRPDFYGTNTPNQHELLSAQMTLEEMKDYYNVDSIGFLSREGMHKAIGLPEGRITMSAFGEDYPIPLGRRAAEVNFNLYR